MHFKSIFFTIFIISIIFSLSSVVATEDIYASSDSTFDDFNMETLSESEYNDNLNVLSEDNQIRNEYDEIISDGTVKDIYVGHSNTTDGGDGSKDNPFTTFKAARDSVDGEDTVNIYVYGGTYELAEGMSKSTDPLIFNTNNLNIIGINGSVIIKNYFNEESDSAEAFSLSSDSANFTFSNLIFDASGVTHANIMETSYPGGLSKEMAEMMGIPPVNYINYFSPFYGENNTGNFVNCSFIDFNLAYVSFELKYYANFLNCYFESNQDTSIFYRISDIDICFDGCVFNFPKGYKLSTYFNNNCNVSLNNVWFGKNSVSFQIPGKTNFYPNSVVSDVISVNNYAIFNVTQSYLGNDEYKIVGKLTWNGTDNQEGMENFQPMTVTLLSENGGEFESTVTLVNGTFETIYKNSASEHKLTAVLHNQDIDLEFTTVNITANPVSIYYGEDQNITVKFSQVINSTVSISINNKTYNVKVNDSDSLNYTVEDILKAGTYTVNIILSDDEKGVYGVNSTTFTVSKVNITNFSPELPGVNPKVGNSVIITIELPSDVSGNVTVYVGETPFVSDATTNTEVNISGFIAGDNTIRVVYSGNDKYYSKSSESIITAEKVTDYDFSAVLPSGVKVGDNASVVVTLPNDTTGNITVYVNDNKFTVLATGNSTTVDVSGFVAGNNTIKVVYSDDKYDEKTFADNITVEKVSDYNLIVVLPTGVKAGDSAIVVVNLPSDVAGNITVYVNDKVFTVPATGNSTNVTVSGFITGSNTIKVIYSDDKYSEKTFTGTVTVNKQTVSKVATKIKAKKKTFKAKKKTKKYKITLKTKAGKAVSKVKVTLKVKGKTYKAKTNAKGKATFKIKKLTKKGKYKAKIKFAGNANYKASSKKVKLTIKK